MIIIINWKINIHIDSVTPSLMLVWGGGEAGDGPRGSPPPSSPESSPKSHRPACSGLLLTSPCPPLDTPQIRGLLLNTKRPCLQAYILKASIGTPTILQKNWPFRKFVQKCHKMAQKWPKMAQSGPNMTQNGPKRPQNYPHFFFWLKRRLSKLFRF